MDTKTFPLDDNPALIHEIRSRIEGGEKWPDLREGTAKPAIQQLSKEDQVRLDNLVQSFE